MLAVRAIDKAFGDRKALVGVTLDVAAGEVVLLVGRNGAGKTTLLRIITGFLDPDAGKVAIGGIDVATARAKSQAKIGYLPEHAPAPVEPIVRDHLYLRARLKGCADPRAAVARVAAAVDIASELERPIGTLSKGYRQRVGLADALLGEPPLLVLDEPTSGLDPLQVSEMREHIAAIVSQSRRAALVSSHAVADLESLATKVAVLREGVLVAFDTPQKMRDRTGTERLEHAVVKLLGETVKLGGRS